MITAEAASQYHCPRWSELPDVPLYMDQVVETVKKALDLFSDGTEPVITAPMINNYVRQKLIDPLVNKKYVKDHITELIVISFFKRSFSMMEIKSVTMAMIDEYGIEESYDLFCTELEEFVRIAFASGDSDITIVRTGDSTEVLLRLGLSALFSKLMVQNKMEDMKANKK
ncbi:MAG: DUF1836 domain-containing protein [Eubacteriales bacterium]